MSSGGRPRRVLRMLWLALAAAAVAAAAADQWEEVGPALGALSVGRLAVSSAAAVVGVGASGLLWRALLGGLGWPLALAPAARVFFVGQLGKYLPGGLWPAVAQMELGRDVAVPRRVSAAAVALFLWVHLLTGVAVAAVALPLAGVAAPAWSLLAVPCLALVAPGVLGRALSALQHLARRPTLPVLPDAPAVLGAACWALAMWSAYGAHLLALVAASDLSLLHATGAFAAAWGAGFVVLVAPAGAGVREAALVALLSPAMPTGAALAAALASRLLLTAADALWGAAGLAVRRVSVRSGSSSPPTR
ncbi:MAG TPA: lysylphosphatidylglycerol synthase domain-containing protein [Egibacteraceae bacterium]|nr:lysylphosphatidylglycerol synthase domain-containing protein [Egibacteraceae bacterium]